MSVLNDILSFCGIVLGEDAAIHYGTKYHSGRYPYGSGKDPYQHAGDFLGRIEQMRKDNFTYTDEDGKTWTGDTAIAKSMGLSTTEFRTQYTIAKDEKRALDVETAKALRSDGYSLQQIAEKMGYNNDSSVRSLLNADSESRMKKAQATANNLKDIVDQKGMIDVGVGVERELGISKEKLKEALYILEREGYPTYDGRIPQVTNPGKYTTVKVLCPPDTPWKDIYDFGEIHSLKDYISDDNGDTFRSSFIYPSSLDSKRLAIRYAEEGGIDKDGVMEIRRGVPDLSLGESHYAQVRIMVDGTHYLKGMAVYSDDLPDGIDIRFNTNKPLGTPQGDVLKKIKSDPDNPFGSLIKEHGGQSFYDDPNGKFIDPVTGKKQSLSLINKRSEEGDWGDWADTLPSQFLSKQSLKLASQQLNLAKQDKLDEYKDISSLTNPTLKKILLKSFSDDCDAAAAHLKAAALPRQKYQVILPLTTISEKEVYAPNYKDGETVALVRYPHGGTFEIPILKVNNKLKEGKDILGTNPKDGIGINAKVAERLSGADFDGDTVMVIPFGPNVKISSSPKLKGLDGFDGKFEYGYDHKETKKIFNKKTGEEEEVTYYYRNGNKFKIMANTGNEMGRISNLITDMTLKGASPDELARAVRHSMVVIDAEKHKLDYKQSERDNDIASLKKKYQGHYDENGKYHESASTLISRSNADVDVLKRKGSPRINPEDGSLEYKSVTETYIDKNGKEQVRTQKSKQMYETKDARTLISDYDTPMERLYADYANSMKALANQSRKDILTAGDIKYNKESAKKYEHEVQSINAKLNTALLNAPRERQAQAMANAVVAAKKKDNPDMTKKEIKKAKQQALSAARAKVGASGRDTKILITDSEWEAIQAGAIAPTKLTQVFNHADKDILKQKAMPRDTRSLSTGKEARIKSMANAGKTNAQIAESLGVSVSTVIDILNDQRRN